MTVSSDGKTLTSTASQYQAVFGDTELTEGDYYRVSVPGSGDDHQAVPDCVGVVLPQAFGSGRWCLASSTATATPVRGSAVVCLVVFSVPAITLSFDLMLSEPGGDASFVHQLHQLADDWILGQYSLAVSGFSG